MVGHLGCRGVASRRSYLEGAALHSAHDQDSSKRVGGAGCV